MGILNTILLVLFILVSILLIIIVSLQDEKQSGLSGVFGGRGGSTFGSQTSSVVVKITTVLSVLFFILALSLAVLSRVEHSSDSITKKYKEGQSQVELTQDNSTSVNSVDNAEAADVEGGNRATVDTTENK